MPVNLVLMQKTDRETCAGRRQYHPKPPRLFRIGKVQHRIYWIGCMPRASCSNAGSPVHERPCEPCRQGPAGSWRELQPFPSEPAQRASYSFYAKDRFHRVRDFKTLFKFAELGFYHPVCGDIMPEFLCNNFAGN
jgi:hypothetical protein